MTRTLRWNAVPAAIVLAACGGNAPPAPVAAPVARTAAAQDSDGSGTRTAAELCLVYGAPVAACGTAAPNPVRRDSAAKAFARGQMALNSSAIKRFATDHPLWDGRGVLIAIMDTGIDPGIPGLITTSEGGPKVLDLRDFSHEGRVALRRAVRHGDTLFVGGRHVLGAFRIGALSADPQIWGGTLAELSLGKAPAADINGNGVVGDSLLIIVTRTTSGWALLTDTNGNGSLDDERPIHDFLVAREFFGWHRPAGPGPALPQVPVHVAANFADSAGTPVLDLLFDTGSHGSHVAGIAAGHDIYGVSGFDGVAPGARIIGLKIADNAHGPVSVSGSMVRALDYAIRFAKDRSMPLVVNLSFGVGNEIEGTARIDALIDSVLTAHPDVIMTVAAGNDGPGLSSLGFPGSAARVISVGATLPLVFGGVDPRDSTAEPIAPFSSRGGEFAAPDLVVPGAAYSTVPNYAQGDELENGTSMAAPYAAGLAARLLSGMLATAHPTNARLVRQALRMGSRALPSGFAVDQGAGLPDLSRAWSWLAATHDFADIAVDVGQVMGRGAVLLTAAPSGSPPRALGARIVLRRLDGIAPLTLRLATDATWLQIPETVTLPAGRGEFTIVIQTQSAATPGMLRGTIRVEGNDETAGALAVIPVNVRVPIPASGTRAPIALHQDAGTIGRVFVPADTGRGLQIEVATLRAADHVSAALHEPGGMPFRDDRMIGAGFAGAAGLYDIDARDVSAGIYELDVEAGFVGPADAKVTVRPSPLRLGATLQHDTLHVTARSLGPAALSVRLRAGLIGGERQLTVNGSGDAPIRVVIPVPTWAGRLVVDTRMPRQAWSRFTDFGLSFLDRRGRLFDNSPINYAFGRATPTMPDSVVGDTMVILLTPGFADPAEHGAWSIDLSVRFYVDKPYSLDAGGSPARPVLPGALREERFVSGALPIPFPPGFVPLVTIVALEGTDHIWTREVTPTRLPGAPR